MTESPGAFFSSLFFSWVFFFFFFLSPLKLQVSRFQLGFAKSVFAWACVEQGDEPGVGGGGAFLSEQCGCGCVAGLEAVQDLKQFISVSDKSE